MTKFDPTKPVTTRDGKPARIVYTDAVNQYSIGALVMQDDGVETTMTYDSRGVFFAGKYPWTDLINVPLTMWGNVYTEARYGSYVLRTQGKLYATKELAVAGGTNGYGEVVATQVEVTIP
jgi:hypothetical protein